VQGHVRWESHPTIFKHNAKPLKRATLLLTSQFDRPPPPHLPLITRHRDDTKLVLHKFVYIELKTAKPVQIPSELRIDVQSLQIPC
jgi:hypothetical protein